MKNTKLRALFFGFIFIASSPLTMTYAMETTLSDGKVNNIEKFLITSQVWHLNYLISHCLQGKDRLLLAKHYHWIVRMIA